MLGRAVVFQIEMGNDKNLSTFDEYCQVCTCTGVLDWHTAKHLFGKVFWGSIVLLCLCLTTWQTWGTVSEFLAEKPYKTALSKELIDEGLPFPNVTVCNFNRIKQSSIERDAVNPKVFTYIFQLFPATYDLPVWYSKQGYFEYEEAFRNYSDSVGLSPLEMLSKYGHTAEDTFFRISLNSDTKIIQTSELEEVFTVHGRCWKVNPNVTQPFPGPSGGLKMVLNPLLSEYMVDGALSNYLQEGLILSIGFIHEPFILQPIYLQPGSAASISLRMYRHTVTAPQTPLRKRRCNENPVLKFVNETYSPSNCLYECFMKTVYDKCRCVFIGRMLKTYPLCNSSTMETCALSSTGATYQWSTDILMKMMTCKTTCGIPCEPYLNVESTMTVAAYPSQKARKVLSNVLAEINQLQPENLDRLLDSAISVNIYYPYPEIFISDTCESTPIFTFIGSLGGQLGLWTGISLLTIVQFVYYIFIGCISSVMPGGKKGKIQF